MPGWRASVENATFNRRSASFPVHASAICVSPTLAAAGELQTRIRTEKDSPKGDVFIGGSSEFHSPLGSEGLLLPYKSANAANVDPIDKDADGMWTGWYLGIFGFVLNTDRFAKELKDSTKPASWDDLLNPAWKGHLTLPDPVKTGGGYIYIATQIFRFAAEAMAAQPESFYRGVVRAGYRSAYLHALAVGVAEGAIELEELGASTDLTDDEVAIRLLALPGIGPYGAAHMMMLLGRHSRLVLDSWTRPKYASLRGRKASDKTIERRFRRYGDYAGLAFWLYLTRDWVAEPQVQNGQ
jgi:hypothetical protein